MTRATTTPQGGTPGKNGDAEDRGTVLKSRDRSGIDFGTTHTVVAAVDRGNYPVLSFDGFDSWPSITAANPAGELRFGHDAAAVRHEPGWSALRSFKRLLNDAGPQTEVNLAGRNPRLADLLTGFLAALKSDL